MINLFISQTPFYTRKKFCLFSIIREDSRDYPGKQWSTEVNPVSERDFAGNWEGTTITYSISDPVPTRLQWGWEGHHVFYLPVTISCPAEVIDGVVMTIVLSVQLDGN